MGVSARRRASWPMEEGIDLDKVQRQRSRVASPRRTCCRAEPAGPAAPPRGQAAERTPPTAAQVDAVQQRPQWTPVGERGGAASSHDAAARQHRRAPGGGAAGTRPCSPPSTRWTCRRDGSAQAATRSEFRRATTAPSWASCRFSCAPRVEALKRFPAVNASIDGNDIVYHGYYDIGVAVSTSAAWWCR